MGNEVIDMSMSLDGYIAAPNDVPGDGLGEAGMRLHDWGFDNPGVFERVFDGVIDDTGAVIMGRRTYDNSIPEWGDSGPIGDIPCFVITHDPPSSAAPMFTFVTDGVDSALAEAREVAATSASGSWAPTSRGSSSRPGWWTRSGSTWSMCCSAGAAGCSRRSRRESS